MANRRFIEYKMDFLPIPEYEIKKGRLHGHRYGKLPEDKEYHLAHNLKKRCKKRDYKGIHDRFLRDHVLRERMIENGRDVCRKWDDLGDQDYTYRMSESEYFQKLEDNNLGPCHSGSISNGKRHRVPPPGGNGESWCLPKNSKKVKKEVASKGLRLSGVTCYLQNFVENPPTNGFQEFIQFCYR